MMSATLSIGPMLVLLAGLAPAPGAAETVTFQQVAKLTASDAAAGDFFGDVVAIDGDRLIVGAFWDDDLGDRSGSAYVFERAPGDPLEWNEAAKLLAPDGGPRQGFGIGVSLSGDTAVVGAYEHDPPYSGFAYVFDRDAGGSWVAMKKLLPPDFEEADYFGTNVAISGDTAVVSASGTDGPGGSTDGAVYVFERDAGGPGAWGQTAKLTPTKACDSLQDRTQCGWDDDDAFGAGLAMGEDVIAAGAEGYVYLFRRIGQGPGSEWRLLTRFVPADFDPGLGTGFGRDLAISGRTLLAGNDSDQDIDDQIGHAGAAYVLESDPGGQAGVRQTAKFYAPDGKGGDWFGLAVGLSGETAVIGAPEITEGSRGFGYIFRREEGSTRSWSAVTKLLPAELEGGDRFGSAVAISGGTAVVGARGDDDRGRDAGAVYVFQEVLADPR